MLLLKFMYVTFLSARSVVLNRGPHGPLVHVILVTKGPPISRWQEQAKMIVLMSNSYEGVHQVKKKGKEVHA